MEPMDETLDQDAPAVERGEDVREVPMQPTAPNGEILVPDLDALVCRSIGPMCLATEHEDEEICRPDDACWTYTGPMAAELEHVSHGGPCWHEVTDDGIQAVIVGRLEPAAVDDGGGDAPDPSPAPVEVVGADPGPLVIPPDSDSRFIDLRDAIYERLRDEGNPRELSIVLASIYAMVVPSEIPETMAMLRQVGASISGVLGDGGSGGIMGKILGRAMKGNG
jgi:hypothetical protein